MGLHYIVLCIKSWCVFKICCCIRRDMIWDVFFGEYASDPTFFFVKRREHVFNKCERSVFVSFLHVYYRLQIHCSPFGGICGSNSMLRPSDQSE